MRLTDKEVCDLLGNTNPKAYRYGTLKPKIDKLMDELSKRIDLTCEQGMQNLKKELIKQINTL